MIATPCPWSGTVGEALCMSKTTLSVETRWSRRGAWPDEGMGNAMISPCIPRVGHKRCIPCIAKPGAHPQGKGMEALAVVLGRRRKNCYIISMTYPLCFSSLQRSRSDQGTACEICRSRSG